MNKSVLLLALAFTFGLSAYAVKKKECNDPWKDVANVEKNIKAPQFNQKNVFNINDFGAKEGVKDYSNKAINKAISACSENGGGVVLVPKGVYYTGPITFKSNVNLYLADSAVLKFSTNPADYEPFEKTRFEGWDCINFHPLIYAYGQTNIAITGKGILDGQADTTNWWPWKGIVKFAWKEGTKSQEWNGTDANGGRNRLETMADAHVPMEQRIMKPEDCLRPAFVEFYSCSNILLSDFKLVNSPFWCLHPLLSNNVTVKGVTVSSHGPNNDGCDPESCTNVLIDGCTFDTGDDCIAIKSGKDDDGRRWNKPSENIIVRNCDMKDGHGGVVLGSEISGGVRNVWVENCTMDSPNLERVVRIKSNPKRGGVLENFFVRNIKVGVCKEAIFRVEMKYEHVTEGPNIPQVKNFVMENVSSNKSKYGIWIDGLENTPQKQINGVTIRNCNFNNVKTPVKIVGAENVNFENLIINGQIVKAQ